MQADERGLHVTFTARLLLETWGVALALAAAAGALASADRSQTGVQLALAVVIALEGCWLHRLYTAGHEAVHRKLVPWRRGLNDGLGQLLLAPLLVPLPVFRKIHAFHHGFNRRDHGTSALDTFATRHPESVWRRVYFHVVWYVAVFGGGFFLHGLVSIVLFLCLPLGVARKVSPAFRGWTRADQLRSLACFAVGVGVHVATLQCFGAEVYVAVLGAPMLVFAWVYSLLVYIYHCRTSYGRPVRLNVRALPGNRLLGWWLLNFNEHVTHHHNPTIPWYRLPRERVELPDSHARNREVSTFVGALRTLLRGPVIVRAASDSEPDARV